MAGAPAKLMTFAEFEQLPDPPGGRYELHHGELVLVAPPKLGHAQIQRQLRRLLEAAAGSAWVVEIEVGFRPSPEYEYWRADVSVLSAKLWEGDPNGYIEGAPDLVIEVLSASNTKAEVASRREICLANGSREFWVVDPKRKQIEVSDSRGNSRTYREGESVVTFLGRIDVAKIFSRS